MSAGGREPIRIGVVGGGMVGQTVHLPTLAGMPDRFALEAVADPSEKVREALAGRWGGLTAVAEWEQLIETPLDAVVVCSPHAYHAEVALAALDAGLHVFVEKPLCIDPADAEEIVRRRDATGLVVQVGYMKRFDPAFHAWLDALPDEIDGLRLIDVVMRDPWMARPPFIPLDFVYSDDVPEAVIRAGAERDRAQVEAATGAGDAASVKAFSYTYLACLIHDVNLVHAALEKLGAPGPLPAISSSHWADGKGATAAFRLPGGAVWNASWILLEGLESYREDLAIYFEDQIHRLSFDAPYLRERPTVHRVVDNRMGAEADCRTDFVSDSYRSQLEHFHDCIVEGVSCLSTPEQATADIVALRDAFLARSS
ncbi:MAG: Gfo/Idh/MocA family oxidoreductase [Actinobacteria bacterium]|nr:Gfo/Idh/MocA family oxidoreductase [Actinomycetota bacterium]